MSQRERMEALKTKNILLESQIRKIKEGPLPLPQRYINKNDSATFKTIEIIGREKYAELLDAGIIMADYEREKGNNERRNKHTEELLTTVKVLSSMINRLGS